MKKYKIKIVGITSYMQKRMDDSSLEKWEKNRKLIIERDDIAKEDLVLDNCIGSGTTVIACVNTKRNFIGIELLEEYCKIANERLTKLNNGDGIPPKPKGLGILPTII